MGDATIKLERMRQHDQDIRPAAGEAIAHVMEFGPEVGVRMISAKETHHAVEVYETGSYEMLLSFTPDGMVTVANALRAKATSKTVWSDRGDLPGFIYKGLDVQMWWTSEDDGGGRQVGEIHWSFASRTIAVPKQKGALDFFILEVGEPPHPAEVTRAVEAVKAMIDHVVVSARGESR